MKKISILLLVLLMGLSLNACFQTQVGPSMNDLFNKSEAILSAKVMDINGTSLLLANMAEDAGPADIYQLNGEKVAFITDADGNKLDVSALERGMLVEIAYDGMLQESFPMGISNATGILIKGQSDDLGGFYRTVIDDLFKVDPGLNDHVEILAFNLTGVVNMTATEKTALIYILGNTYKMTAFAGTYEELCEQGYINKEKMYFEKGLLFTIEDTMMSDGSFTFDADKWRGGDGAYYFHECTAKKTQDGWNYTIGAEMIS
jgi:hypothetical protein